MCSGVQRCGLCYRWLEHCLCKCSVRAPACMHHSRPSLHARMTASIMHHAMQPSDCLVDPGVFDRCLPPMDDAMPWDSAVTDACLPWMMRCLGIWQRAPALLAMGCWAATGAARVDRGASERVWAPPWRSSCPGVTGNFMNWSGPGRSREPCRVLWFLFSLVSDIMELALAQNCPLHSPRRL